MQPIELKQGGHAVDNPVALVVPKVRMPKGTSLSQKVQN
jgi:hypothetical protein